MATTWTTVNRSKGQMHQNRSSFQPKQKRTDNWMHKAKNTHRQKEELSSQLYYQVRKMYNRAQKHTRGGGEKGDRFSERDFVNWLVRLQVPLSNWVFLDDTWFHYSPNGEITALPDMSQKRIEGERLLEPRDIPIILAIHELSRSPTDNQETFKFLEDQLRERDPQYPWTQVINTISGSQLYTPFCRSLWHGNPNIGATLLRMGADVGFENSHGEGLNGALSHGRQSAEQLYATNRMMWQLEKRTNRTLEEDMLLNRLRECSKKGKAFTDIQVTRDDQIAVSDKFDLCELQLRSRQKALQQEKERQEMDAKRQRLTYLEKSREWSCLDEETMTWGSDSLATEYQKLKKELDVAPKRWTGRGGEEGSKRPIALWKLRKTLRDAGGMWKTEADGIIKAHDEKARLIKKGDLERNPSDPTERQELEPLYQKLMNEEGEGGVEGEGEGVVLDGW